MINTVPMLLLIFLRLMLHCRPPKSRKLTAKFRWLKDDVVCIHQLCVFIEDLNLKWIASAQATTPNINQDKLPGGKCFEMVEMTTAWWKWASTCLWCYATCRVPDSSFLAWSLLQAAASLVSRNHPQEQVDTGTAMCSPWHISCEALSPLHTDGFMTQTSPDSNDSNVHLRALQ